jgi:hypothetical protein
VSATSRWQNLVILYDRLTPAAQQRLIDHLVAKYPQRAIDFTRIVSELRGMKKYFQN